MLQPYYMIYNKAGLAKVLVVNLVRISYSLLLKMYLNVLILKCNCTCGNVLFFVVIGGKKYECENHLSVLNLMSNTMK